MHRHHKATLLRSYADTMRTATLVERPGGARAIASSSSDPILRRPTPR